MAKDLKKFINLRFIKTIDLGLLRRLFERQPSDRIDLTLFQGGEVVVREALQNFFAGPEDSRPEGLVADLHRIAELGTVNGLRLLLEQAERRGEQLVDAGEADAPQHDPKHVALLAFLGHEAVFNAASDLLILEARPTLTEFAGAEEGVEPKLEPEIRAAFEMAARTMFARDLNGRYCRVGWYEDGDEISVVVTHGAPVTTAPVIEGDEERVISFRSAEHAVLAFTPLTGRLKVGGVAKARRADLAEIFARTMLGRPEFFAGADSQNLYTLEPVERAGFGFTIDHAFDAGIQKVQIVEVQADRISTDPRSGEIHVQWSLVARDSRQSALARLGETTRGLVYGPNGYRLGHMVLRVQFAPKHGRPSRVTIKIKPPGTATFRRQSFEGRIMKLLRRNGLCREHASADTTFAAE